jgi:hypothetical protein
MNQLVLGANDKVRCLAGEPVESAEIDVSPIHDVESPGLQDQFVQGQVVGRSSAGNVHKTGDIASQVQKGMQLDCAFVSAKLSPAEQAQAEVDSGGIEHVGRLFQGYTKAVFGIQSPGDSDEHLCEVGIDPPISRFVGIGQCTSRDLSPEAGVIEFGLHGSQTGLDISQAFAKGQLSECHAKKLVETVEGSRTMVAAIATDTASEIAERHKVDHHENML